MRHSKKNIDSYLSNRQQTTKINPILGRKSCLEFHKDPLLFNIFICDLFTTLEVTLTVVAVAVLSVILSSSLVLLIYQYYFLYQLLFLNFLYVSFCFTSMYPTTFFLRDHNGNKVTQLFCAIPPISPYRDVFYHSFNFNKLIFVYVANIRFTCDLCLRT